jgi:hypothetical protein
MAVTQKFNMYDRVAYVPRENEPDMEDLGTVVEVFPVRQRTRTRPEVPKVLHYLYTVTWDNGAAPYNTDTYTERQITKVADAPPMASVQDFETQANFGVALYA